MQDKPYWKSKTWWSGMLIAAGGLIGGIGRLLMGDATVAQMLPYVVVMANGFGLVGLRDAIGKYLPQVESLENMLRALLKKKG